MRFLKIILFGIPLCFISCLEDAEDLSDETNIDTVVIVKLDTLIYKDSIFVFDTVVIVKLDTLIYKDSIFVFDTIYIEDTTGIEVTKGILVDSNLSVDPDRGCSCIINVNLSEASSDSLLLLSYRIWRSGSSSGSNNIVINNGIFEVCSEIECSEYLGSQYILTWVPIE